MFGWGPGPGDLRAESLVEHVCVMLLSHALQASASWPGSLQPGQNMFLTPCRGSGAHPAPYVLPGVTVSRAGLNPLLLKSNACQGAQSITMCSWGSWGEGCLKTRVTWPSVLCLAEAWGREAQQTEAEAGMTTTLPANLQSGPSEKWGTRFLYNKTSFETHSVTTFANTCEITF